jgi:hypothetical protein
MTTRRTIAPKQKYAEFRMQSVRLTKGENRRMKQLAKRLGLSFNLWAVQTLLAELDRQTKGAGHERSKDGAVGTDGAEGAS